MKKIAYSLRVVTVPPFMALIMLFGLYFCVPGFYGGFAAFVLSVVFLVVFPLLGYPLQPLIKSYKDKGREGQRKLAILFAVSGYILGLLFAVLLRASVNVLIIFLSYFISGLLIMLSGKVFHFKASGHACGVAGPFILLVYFGLQWGIFAGIVLLSAAWVCSKYMGRHSHPQLAAGTLIPFVALGIIILIKPILY